MRDWVVKNSQIFDRDSVGFLKKWWVDLDKINFLLILTLIVFGVVMTATSSPAIASRIGIGKFAFLKKQIIFATIACFLLVFISFFNEKQIKIFVIFNLLIILTLLVAVLVFGSEAKGSKRWLNIAGFTLQPSEFVKIFFIVFNAYILQKFHNSKWQIKYLISTITYLIIASLLILQPDFGMTLVLTILWATQLFIYGIPMFTVAIIGIALISGSIFAYFLLPHVQDRIHRFLDADVQNYQVDKSLDAFANGSFFGKGLGNGVVKNFIPDAHTDFVFAVIGEEFGIFACIIILLTFLYLATRIIRRLLDEDNLFAYLALFSLMMQFCLQVAINIGVSVSMFPTKGMTLPFISYGGSSMISMSICFGLILAFTKKKYNQNIDYGNVKLV